MTPFTLLQVEWTNSATKSFSKIIEWLNDNWSGKEVNSFIRQTEQFIETIQRHPESCRPSQKRKNVRIGLLNKHTQLVYHYSIRNKKITILLFWPMKQNPNLLKY